MLIKAWGSYKRVRFVKLVKLKFNSLQDWHLKIIFYNKIQVKTLKNPFYRLKKRDFKFISRAWLEKTKTFYLSYSLFNFLFIPKIYFRSWYSTAFIILEPEMLSQVQRCIILLLLKQVSRTSRCEVEEIISFRLFEAI